MRDFLGLLPRDVNKALGRRGDGVVRRHSQVHVLDDDAALERLSYILANPARAHVVDTIGVWPGLSSARAGCPDDRSPFEQEIELAHGRLPGART